MLGSNIVNLLLLQHSNRSLFHVGMDTALETGQNKN